MHRLHRGPALAILTLVSLTACVPLDSPPTPTPTSSTIASAPLFATEEEAIAAAEEVYRAYWRAMGDGPDIERLRQLTTPEWLEVEIDSAEEFRAKDLVASGEVHVISMSLQSRSRSEVVAYACVDFTGTQILDGSGVDVTPSTRPPQSLMTVEFAVYDDGLRIKGSELWSKSCS